MLDAVEPGTIYVAVQDLFVVSMAPVQISLFIKNSCQFSVILLLVVPRVEFMPTLSALHCRLTAADTLVLFSLSLMTTFHSSTYFPPSF